tara:strand:- start:382 stop:978 length:597 start_codon:yes stop_codon:yes gene_type:complete
MVYAEANMFTKNCPECGNVAEWEYELDYPETHVPECLFAGYRCSECGWEYEDADNLMPECHPTIKSLVSGFGETYYSFYRAVYKTTDCGPVIGFYLSLNSMQKWLYGDDLYNISLGQYPAGAVSISSIVEGSDAEVDPIILHGSFSEEDFWQALEQVNQEATELWEEANEEPIMESLQRLIRTVEEGRSTAYKIVANL